MSLVLIYYNSGPKVFKISILLWQIQFSEELDCIDLRYFCNLSGVVRKTQNNSATFL